MDAREEKIIEEINEKVVVQLVRPYFMGVTVPIVYGLIVALMLAEYITTKTIGWGFFNGIAVLGWASATMVYDRAYAQMRNTFLLHTAVSEGIINDYSQQLSALQDTDNEDDLDGTKED